MYATWALALEEEDLMGPGGELMHGDKVYIMKSSFIHIVMVSFLI
jgi:hypothetical protein